MINLTLNINSNKTSYPTYIFRLNYTYNPLVALSYFYILFEDNERR